MDRFEKALVDELAEGVQAAIEPYIHMTGEAMAKIEQVEFLLERIEERRALTQSIANRGGEALEVISAGWCARAMEAFTDIISHHLHDPHQNIWEDRTFKTILVAMGFEEPTGESRMTEEQYGTCAGCGVQETVEILEQLGGYHSSECERDHKEMLEFAEKYPITNRMANEAAPVGPDVTTMVVRRKMEMHTINQQGQGNIVYANQTEVMEPMFYLDFPRHIWNEWGQPETITVVIG